MPNFNKSTVQDKAIVSIDPLFISRRPQQGDGSAFWAFVICIVIIGIALLASVKEQYTRRDIAERLFKEGKLERKAELERLGPSGIEVLYGYYDGNYRVFPNGGDYGVARWETKE